MQLVEQRLLVDAIEAAFDVGIEDKLRFEPNAVADCSAHGSSMTWLLLFAQQNSQRSTPPVVVAEPLTPVQQVSVVRASSSLHFDVSLDLRMAMIP